MTNQNISIWFGLIDQSKISNKIIVSKKSNCRRLASHMNRNILVRIHNPSSIFTSDNLLQSNAMNPTIILSYVMSGSNKKCLGIGKCNSANIGIGGKFFRHKTKTKRWMNLHSCTNSTKSSQIQCSNLGWTLRVENKKQIGQSMNH